VNKFSSDTPAEMQMIVDAALKAGAFAACPATHWAEGGKGAAPLANALVAACASNSAPGFRFLYGLDQPIKAKIEAVRLVSGAFLVA
jgi:formyltetrahydrofolate synthetase